MPESSVPESSTSEGSASEVPVSSVRSHPGVRVSPSRIAASQVGAAGSGPAPARDVDAWAEPIAEAVLGCPSVASMSGGPWGTVGTYLPGRRVPGVQITDTDVTIRVVAHLAPLRMVESEVRAAVGALAPGLPVFLAIDDILTDSTH